MTKPHSVADWMRERSFSLEQLLAATSLDRRVVDAIIERRYTPSPKQREQIASALGVTVEEITWDHSVTVEHIQGHGPQFGRSP